MTEVNLEQMTAARHEHLVPGREIHLQDMRGSRFCEVGLITGTSPDDAMINIWNTTGSCDPTPEQFDALDADAVARENEALGAWLNPVRHWMFDRLDVWEAGDSRTFGDITGTWMGVTGMTPATDDSYRPGYVYRHHTLTFSAGSEVYLLEAPDGEVFVMQSWAPHQEPAASEDSPAHLGGRLDLPAGWGYRAELLDQDLEVSSGGHDKRAHLLHDNLHNVYQGSDVGRAFTQFCGQDAEW